MRPEGSEAKKATDVVMLSDPPEARRRRVSDPSINTKKRRPSFADDHNKPLVTEVIDVDGSPDSITARHGDTLPPPLDLGVAWNDRVFDAFDRNAIPIIATLVLVLCIPELTKLATLGWQKVASSVVVEADPMTLVGVATAGFLAQLVDGALGMGYGLTSSTVLVAAGVSPRTASQVVHLAQLGTTLVSGIAHHRCGTVHWPTAWRLAAPGVTGALVGASLLSSLPVAAAKTMASALLLVVGLYLFTRFYSPSPRACDPKASPRALVLAPIGLVGGFIDVAGGGGWGPVATCGLLAEGRLPPSGAIGTVSMSEFFVTVAAVAGFCLSTGGGAAGGAAAASGSVRFDLMLTLLAGGLLAAPVAPLFVTRLDSQLLGVLVGGFICLTNARVLLKAAAVPSGLSAPLLALLACVWVGASLRVATRTATRSASDQPAANHAR